MKALKSKNPRRKERYTIYCPLDHQEFAKRRAEQLNLRGGVSELIQRLLAAEKASKRGIAGRNKRTLPEIEFKQESVA